MKLSIRLANNFGTFGPKGKEFIRIFCFPSKRWKKSKEENIFIRNIAKHTPSDGIWRERKAFWVEIKKIVEIRITKITTIWLIWFHLKWCQQQNWKSNSFSETYYTIISIFCC